MDQRRSTRRVIAVLLALPALLLLSSLGADRVGADHSGVRATLQTADGASVGTVRISSSDGVVTVRAEVRGLAPGFHGFHIHSVGECVPPFTSAGGHFNPGGSGHGDHAGDMPSLLVNQNGRGFAVFGTDRFNVADLFDADGSAVVVHADKDNFANIPADRYHSHTEDVMGPDSATLATGDAGSRTACGVVRR